MQMKSRILHANAAAKRASYNIPAKKESIKPLVLSSISNCVTRFLFSLNNYYALINSLVKSIADDDSYYRRLNSRN